jgi:DHA2 family multidrug resistance protein-like MFS transporter
VGFIVGSMLTPKITNYFRKTTIMAFGLLLAAVGFVVLSRVDNLGLTAVVGSSILFSFGLAPLFTLITDMILSAVSPERAGAAGALSETSSELGGALGIAVLGSIGAAIYRLRMTGNLPSGLSAEDGENAISTIGGAMAVSARLPQNAAASLQEVAKHSFIYSIETMAIISAVLCVLLAFTVLYAFRASLR